MNNNKIDSIRRKATISADSVYRYSLTREWWLSEEKIKWICFCGLNPSIADEKIDDPTIGREIGFAQSLGANALIKVNIYAYRATDPKELIHFISKNGLLMTYGGENTEAIKNAVKLARSGIGKGVFAAWGDIPKNIKPSKFIINLLGKPIMCLGISKNNSPRHTLFLPKTACPQEWKNTY